MNKKSYNQKKNKILEKIKWLSISIIFILLFVLNNYFYKIKLFIRILVISCLIICMINILISTKKGKYILSYIDMSKREMQKIIWPQYKDTLYTTFIVIAVTIIMSFLLWSLDSIIFRLIAFIISLRL